MMRGLAKDEEDKGSGKDEKTYGRKMGRMSRMMRIVRRMTMRMLVM